MTEYLLTLNPLSRKLTEAVQYGERWSECQEDPGNESLLDILKIKSGEKIVVDFDNEDGWTWRDEHSGPFSWMTRSQQDLSVLDDDYVDSGITASKSTKQDYFPKNRLSQQFSLPQGDEGVGGLSEIEAAFQKFGLSQVTTADESQTTLADTSSVKLEEELKSKDVTASSEFSLNSKNNDDMSQTTDSLSCHTSGTMSPNTEHTAFVTAEDASSSLDVTPLHKPHSTDKYKNEFEAEEESLMASIEEPVHTYKDTGHLSPSFEIDPLDAFTELQPQTVNEMDSETVLSDKPVAGCGYDNLGTVNDSSFEEDLNKKEVDNVNEVVSGFDFLDNW